MDDSDSFWLELSLLTLDEMRDTPKHHTLTFAKYEPSQPVPIP